MKTIEQLNSSDREKVFHVYQNYNCINVRMRTTCGFEYTYTIGKRGAIKED